MRGIVLPVAVAICLYSEAVACQPCVTLALYGKYVRVIVGPRLVGEKEVPVVNAKVRVFRVRKLERNEKPRQALSCFAAYEVGQRVWSGKTDKDGTFSLERLSAGTYWLAVKAANVEVVHVVEIPELAEREDKSTLEATDGGYVMNKCGTEPISAFF